MSARSAILMLALMTPGTAASQGPVCFRSWLGTYRLEVPRFVGTAMTDTVVAGPGREPVPEPAWKIYGQVFRLETADSSLSATLRGTSALASMEVVLVPWGLSDGCGRTLPWRSSTRWVPTGTRALLSGRLREREQWVGDRPTFDVWLPAELPYPSSGIARRRLREIRERFPDRDSTILTPDELLILYEAMPPSEAAVTGPTAYAAIEPLLAWMRAHPDLADRPPAPSLITDVLYELERRRLASIRSPLAGTYRFTLTLPGGEPTTIFTRTEVAPTSGLPLPGVEPEPITGTRWETRRTAGYYLLTQSATAIERLPRTRDSDGAQGYLALIESPVFTSPDSTTWRGNLDLRLLASVFVGDSLIAAGIRSVARRVWDLGIPATTTGTWTLDRTGALRFNWVLRDGNNVLITVRGERISLDVISPP